MNNDQKIKVGDYVKIGGVVFIGDITNTVLTLRNYTHKVIELLDDGYLLLLDNDDIYPLDYVIEHIPKDLYESSLYKIMREVTD